MWTKRRGDNRSKYMQGSYTYARKYSIQIKCCSQFMWYLKVKSSLMIFDIYANLKYKYGQRSFWARGYYVSTVGLNKNTIKK